MIKLQRFPVCLILLILLSVLCSCAGGRSTVEALTEAEKDAVTAHIRKFVSRARTLGLSRAELRIIQTQKPKFSIHYDGYKRGFMSVRWQLPAYRALILQRTGNLIGNNRSDWMIRLISDKTSGKIPSHFFGANGEDISLPSPGR